MDVRLILDPPALGSVNMAIDEALLESAGRGQTVLRFYSWARPTLSLGYFQAYEDRRLHEASAALDVVRRSTGGGAIVHDRELTYSFATPIAERFSEDHQNLVRAFHEALCESLANWQIAADLYRPALAGAPHNRETTKNSFLCFQRRANDDVVLGGVKIAGSAQRRRRNAILQHGSVLLEKSLHAPELPGVGDIAELPPTLDELSAEWSARIGARLGCSLVRGEISNEERQLAEDHRRIKFEAAKWQKRR